MSDDFNIQEFANLLDAALASDNPSVKKALRNFMLIAAIAESETRGESDLRGPFTSLFKQLEELNQRIVKLELDAAVKRSSQHDFNKNYTTTTPNTNPYTINDWTIPPSTWSSSSISSDDVMKGYLYGAKSMDIFNDKFKGIIDTDAN